MKGHSFTDHKIHIFLIYGCKICLMWHFSWSNYKMKCVRGVVKLTFSGGVGGGWGVCNSFACEGSDAAPSRLSTWLEVLIQLSLLDHHYIDSAAQRAGTLTGWIDGDPTDWVTAWRKKPRSWVVLGTNKSIVQARAGGPSFFKGP